MSLEYAIKICDKMGKGFCVIKCNDFDIMKYDKAKRKNKKIVYKKA